jgi:hypothetical protein
MPVAFFYLELIGYPNNAQRVNYFAPKKLYAQLSGASRSS